jgi:hypothetical protein
MPVSTNKHHTMIDFLANLFCFVRIPKPKPAPARSQSRGGPKKSTSARHTSARRTSARPVTGKRPRRSSAAPRRQQQQQQHQQQHLPIKEEYEHRGVDDKVLTWMERIPSNRGEGKGESSSSRDERASRASSRPLTRNSSGESWVPAPYGTLPWEEED